MVKLAVTAFAASMTKEHAAPFPAHAPLQFVKVEPAAGLAESARLLPPAKFALHVVPQLMPVGVEATVPLPLPLFVTLTLWRVGAAAAAHASLEYGEYPALL
jgi:hypothetical protein